MARAPGEGRVIALSLDVSGVVRGAQQAAQSVARMSEDMRDRTARAQAKIDLGWQRINQRQQQLDDRTALHKRRNLEANERITQQSGLRLQRFQNAQAQLATRHYVSSRRNAEALAALHDRTNLRRQRTAEGLARVQTQGEIRAQRAASTTMQMGLRDNIAQQRAIVNTHGLVTKLNLQRKKGVVDIQRADDQLAQSQNRTAVTSLSRQRASQAAQTANLRAMVQQARLAQQLGALNRVGGGGRGGSGGGGNNVPNSPVPLPNGPNRFAAAMQNLTKRTTQGTGALQVLQSVGQGVMIGMDAAEGNVRGLAFGMIFLRFSMIPVALAAATVTAALNLTVRTVNSLAIAGEKAAVSWEALGQQFASFQRSGAKATEIMRQADEMSQRLGVPKEEAANMLNTLERFNLRSQTYVNAITNAAAATGQSLTEVNSRFTAILLADANQRDGLMRQFAKDFDIPIRHYANTLEMAKALQDRFAGSAAAAASTSAGMINKMTAAWDSLRLRVGTLLMQVIKPFFEPIMLFINSAIEGFNEAQQAATVSGRLAQNMSSMQTSIRRLLPFAKDFGHIFGVTIFNAIMGFIRVVKTSIDTIFTFWRRIKPVVDTLWQYVSAIKNAIGWVIGFYTRHKDLIDAFLKTYGMLILLNSALKLTGGLLNLLLSPIAGIVKSLMGLYNTAAAAGKAIGIIGEAFMSAASTAASAIASIAKGLAGLASKVIDITVKAPAMAAWNAFKDFIGHLKDDALALKNALENMKQPPAMTPAPAGQSPSGPQFPPNWQIGQPLKIQVEMPDATGMGTNWRDMLKRSILSSAINIPASLFVVSPEVGLIVAAVLATVIVAGLVIAFPKQTGQIAGGIVAGILGAMILIPAMIITGMVVLTATIVRMMIETMKIAFMGNVAFLTPFVEGVVNLLQNGFGDVKKIFTSLFHGDFLGAAQGAFDLVKHLFITFPMDILSSIASNWIPFFTVDIPKYFGKLKDIAMDALGVTGVLGVFNTVQDLIKKGWDGWFGKFFGGFSEGFDKVNEFTGGALGRMWEIIRSQLGDWNGGGLLGLFGWAVRTLQQFFNFVNPFSRLMDFLRELIDLATTAVDKVADIGGGAVGFVGDVFRRGNGKALGGTVGGSPNTPQLMIAHGGEQFLGTPTIANARPSGANHGGGDVIINVNVSNSVVTNKAAMRDLAGEITDILANRMTGGRKFTLHTTG